MTTSSAGYSGHAEVLRDRLTRKEQGTDLEKGLAVARRQFVEDEAPRLVVESTENIDHILAIGKSALAYQGRTADTFERPCPGPKGAA